MNNKNSVYIGISIDGYIAGKNGELDWLDMVPNPEQNDMGYFAFMDRIDALIMGRNTFEMVCSFEGDWPYAKPVFVLSQSLTEIPPAFADKAFLISGSLEDILNKIHQKGFHRLYIDGGKTIQGFLKEDRIDELITTTIPIILGDGVSLFASMPGSIKFNLEKSETLLGQMVQSQYTRIR